MKQFLKTVAQNGERWLMLFFYILLVLSVFIEVFRRFVLSYSSIWGEEVARYAFIYLVWISTAAVVRDRSHICIDVLTLSFSEKYKNLFFLLSGILTLVLSCYAFYWSLETVLVSLKFQSVTHGLRISKAIFNSAVPFGFLLIIIRTLQAIFCDCKNFYQNKPARTKTKLFEDEN